MKTVIESGNRVVVTLSSYGQTHKPFKATVIEWTPSGKLKIKDDNGKTKTVSSAHVKKIADV